MASLTSSLDFGGVSSAAVEKDETIIIDIQTVERYRKYKEQPESLKIYKHDLNEFIEFLVPEFEGKLIDWGMGKLG